MQLNLPGMGQLRPRTTCCDCGYTNCKCRCVDCGACTLAVDERYMVVDRTWRKSGLDPTGGELCIGCIEQRVGRPLTPADFVDVPLNNPWCTRLSRNVLDRMGSRAHVYRHQTDWMVERYRDGLR